MKKILIGISFLTLSVASVSASTCVDLQNNLIKGKETSEVLSLQNFLVTKGFLTAKPNGYFGSGTMLAVKKYQKSMGLSQSGQVFPLTRATIKKETCSNTPTSTIINTNTQTLVPKSTVVPTTKPIVASTTVIAPKVVLTNNDKRQADVVSLLSAMYSYFSDSRGAWPISYVTQTPVEICNLGIGQCDSVNGVAYNEVRAELVPRFLSAVPRDPTITTNIASTTGSGYFITRLDTGDIKITAPKADTGANIYATCNFNGGCKIKTIKDIVIGKPQIDSIPKTIFLSGGFMDIPLTIYGKDFSTSSNIVSLSLVGSNKRYTLGSFTSASGTMIEATSSFTNALTPCGTNCLEIPQSGNYYVTVKTNMGESNTGYISIQKVTASSISNGNDVSFKPKSTHVKLGTISISSPTLVSLKALNIHASSSATTVTTYTKSTTSFNLATGTLTLPLLSTKLSNYTLTDVTLDKIINGGPSFTITNQDINNNQSKIYELYANIADIENIQAGPVILTGEFIVEENITKSKTTVPIPKFVISISY